MTEGPQSYFSPPWGLKTQVVSPLRTRAPVFMRRLDLLLLCVCVCVCVCVCKRERERGTDGGAVGVTQGMTQGKFSVFAF